LAVDNYSTSEHRTDARQCVELLDRREIDVDRAAG
jgi:hypothetical protein